MNNQEKILALVSAALFALLIAMAALTLSGCATTASWADRLAEAIAGEGAPPPPADPAVIAEPPADPAMPDEPADDVDPPEVVEPPADAPQGYEGLNDKGDGNTYRLRHPVKECDRKAGQIVVGTKDGCGGTFEKVGYWASALNPYAVSGRHLYVTRRPPENHKDNPARRVTWSPNLKEQGSYTVHVCWRATANRARKVQYQLVTTEGLKKFTRNQRVDSVTYSGIQCSPLGTFTLDSTARLTMPNGPDHSESADGAFFLKVAQ